MKKSVSLLLGAIFIMGVGLHAQNNNSPGSNTDSAAWVFISLLPPNMQTEYKNAIDKATENDKRYMLHILGTQASPRLQMIRNLDSNYDNIVKLKTQFGQLVPKGYHVFITFKNDGHSDSMGETYDLTIRQTDKKGMSPAEWKYDPHNAGADRMIKETLGWGPDTIMHIRKLLKAANCISIENGKITTIGFAREGLTDYLYNFFPADLTAGEKEKFNNLYAYSFYKKNIVIRVRRPVLQSVLFMEPE